MGNLGCILLHTVILVVLCTSYVDVAKGKITDPAEVNALMAVKRTLVDPGNNLKNWSRGDPCTSRWTGIFCVEIPSDEYLHVAKIQLFKMNLSGILAPEVGLLSQLETLDFMWNSLTGSIPKEIGNIKTLSVLTLNGNQLSGSLPDEIGNLLNLNRLQIDQNQISGPIPKSFANLRSVKHIHMNNNSLSGQIPSELSRLPALLHLLVDSNNLSGPLPPELADMPSLQILQADNNNFSGTSIPAEYSNIRTLLKLSLRNCSLQGAVPDLSGIPEFGYLDLSWNKLKGPIPTNKLASSITTIDLSHNFLNGTIPSNMSGLSNLQLLSVEGNLLNGAVPSTIWSNINFTGNIVLDLQNNSFDSIPAVFEPPEAVTVLLYGNPLCSSIPARATNLCRPGSVDRVPYGLGPQFGSKICAPCPTNRKYEQNPIPTIPCFCTLPLGVGIRLKSPGISDFRPYKEAFEIDLRSALDVGFSQLYIERYLWEPGPRLSMHFKLFPREATLFNVSEVLRLRKLFAGWEVVLSDVFGPYELLNLTLTSYSKNGALIDSPVAPSTGPSRKRGTKIYIIAGTSSGLFGICTILTFLLWYKRYYSVMPWQKRSRNVPRIESFLQKQGTSHPKRYTYSEVRKMTKSFAHKLGQGGYGAVFRGNLPDGREIAVKMLKDTEGDGEEFMNEVASISRTSHVNIVTLLGFCLQGSKRALVYEYMPNGSLERFTFGNSYTEQQDSLSWERLFEIVVGIARGLEYLHSGCNTRIVHFDIKPQNILLDQDFCPKISDFGLAKLCLRKESQFSIAGARGTIGYIAPELFSRNSGAVSTKSDVYSFGMVVLEMAGARKQIDVHTDSSSKYFPQWLYDNLDQFCSPTTELSSDTTELARKMVTVALWCIQFTPSDRPSMSKVLDMLESNTMDLQLPPKAFWAG